MGREDENLISIDEVIRRARDLGVSFRNGDPRNRLRYYVKIGLLPNAKRKSFNNNSPEGAYPENVVGLLFEIDRKIKTGKSIQIIKREIKEEKEKKREKKKENLEARLFETPIHIYTPLPSPSEIKEEFQPEKPCEITAAPISRGKLSVFLKPVFIVLIFGLIVFFINAKINFRDSISYFLANMSSEVRKLVQAPSPSPREESEEIFNLPTIKPYLTINAETAINSSLNVKESVSSPAFIMTKEGFKGLLTLTALTTDRTYTFPNQSGLVCLSTGNCVGLGGEIIGVGALPNRLAKFISPTRVGNSSISDFYPGVAMTIDALGRIGIGTLTPRAKLEVSGDFLTPNLFVSGERDGKVGIKMRNPKYDLHVKGRIQATGDICTDMAGGKCLSQLTAAFPFFFGGIGGSGSTGYLPIWTGATTLGNSIVSQSGATLTVAGNGYFQGPLTITTSNFPQLALNYDTDNYLRFLINSTSSEISSSKTMLINSLTGEIRLADDVNVFEAAGAEIHGRTFISTTTDSTVRKSGELVLRASIPIFRFPIAGQTTSTVEVAVSKTFSLTDSLNSITPDQLPGTSRVYAFLINFADNIAETSNSIWRVYRPSAATTSFAFEFSGQNLSSLEVGNPHLTSTTTLPDNDWQLEVKIPSPDKTIRIFNIFLLTFDQIN